MQPKPDSPDSQGRPEARDIATPPGWAMRAATDDLLSGRMPDPAVLFLAYRQAWALDLPGT